jgi:hypothetical protein
LAGRVDGDPPALGLLGEQPSKLGGVVAGARGDRADGGHGLPSGSSPSAARRPAVARSRSWARRHARQTRRPVSNALAGSTRSQRLHAFVDADASGVAVVPFIAGGGASAAPRWTSVPEAGEPGELLAYQVDGELLG